MEHGSSDHITGGIPRLRTSKSTANPKTNPIMPHEGTMRQKSYLGNPNQDGNRLPARALSPLSHSRHSRMGSKVKTPKCSRPSPRISTSDWSGGCASWKRCFDSTSSAGDGNVSPATSEEFTSAPLCSFPRLQTQISCLCRGPPSCCRPGYAGFPNRGPFRSLERAPAFFWKTFASSSFHLGSAGFIIVVLGASSSHTRFFELKASAPQLNGDHDEKHLKKDRLGRAVSD